MKDFLFSLMTKISGQPYNSAWEDKVLYIFNAIIFLAIFIVFFVYLFYRYFWQDQRLRKLFFLSTSTVFFLVMAKYLIYHFIQGYIPDRFLFYALPSPRIENFFWFMFPAFIFLGFIIFRKKIESLSRRKFLVVISLFFILFTLAVAGVRGGISSIIDPLTRTHWEYTGAIPFVQETGVKNFLGNFTGLISELPVHTQTHPPGYTLFLFFLQFITGVGYFGLSVFLVCFAGLCVWPLFYLWEAYFSSDTARKMVEVFIFLPNLVMFSATSMEAFFIFIVWVSIFLCFFGWSKNMLLSAIAGVFLAYSLFSNFLFLLLAPFFLFLFIYILKNNKIGKAKVIVRVIISLLIFLASFVLLWYWSGYSVLDNFFKAHTMNSYLVESNFSSLKIYFIYFVMNVFGFLTYLGIPLLYTYFSGGTKENMYNNFWFMSGLGILFFFLFIGIFQGEIERIWLFITPFFIVFIPQLYKEYTDKQFNAVLSLLFFQVIIFQVLFYTYW